MCDSGAMNDSDDATRTGASWCSSCDSDDGSAGGAGRNRSPSASCGRLTTGSSDSASAFSVSSRSSSLSTSSAAAVSAASAAAAVMARAALPAFFLGTGAVRGFSFLALRLKMGACSTALSGGGEGLRLRFAALADDSAPAAEDATDVARLADSAATTLVACRPRVATGVEGRESVAASPGVGPSATDGAGEADRARGSGSAQPFLTGVAAAASGVAVRDGAVDDGAGDGVAVLASAPFLPLPLLAGSTGAAAGTGAGALTATGALVLSEMVTGAGLVCAAAARAARTSA